METRETLSKLGKIELLGIIHTRGIRGHSGKNKAALVELILNPAGAAVKSPGRPAGSGTKAKPEAPKKPRTPGKSSLTVEYTKDGLNGTTSEVLKKLAHYQNITSVSNKKKADIITMLLQKPLNTSIIVSTETKAGSKSDVTVLASGARAAQGSPRALAASVLAPPVSAPSLVPQSAIVPPPIGNLSPRAASALVLPPSYVPAVGFRQ